jgi:hypothetical protein
MFAHLNPQTPEEDPELVQIASSNPQPYLYKTPNPQSLTPDLSTLNPISNPTREFLALEVPYRQAVCVWSGAGDGAHQTKDVFTTLIRLLLDDTSVRCKIFSLHRQLSLQDLDFVIKGPRSSIYGSLGVSSQRKVYGNSKKPFKPKP